MKGKRKREIFLAIPVLVLVVVLGVSIPMVVRIREKMELTASKNVINATYIIENSVSSKLKGDMKALRNFAQSGLEMSEAQMKLFCGSSGFFQIAVIGTDGTGYNCDGEEVNIEDIGNNMSVITQKKAGISECYYDKTGKKAIAFGIPMTSNGEVTGALYAERYVQEYYSDSDFAFYGGAGRGYLIEAETGEFILQPDNINIWTDSLYTNLIDSGNDQKLVKKIKRMIAEEETGTARVNYDKKPSYICFTPVGDNKAWNLVAVISEADLVEESAEIRRTIIFTLVIVTVGVIAALVAIFAIILKGRKETEQKRRIDLFESISSSVEHSFVVYNPFIHQVEFASENFGRIFGLDTQRARHDIIYLFEWLGIPEDDPLRVGFLNGTVKEHYEREVKIQEKGGVRWVKSEVAPNMNGKYIAVLTDITKEKEYADTLSVAMKNAEKANIAKSEFLSSMSHDIRTPMNGIIGMTAIALANLEDSEKVKDCLKKISGVSAHLMSLINEVLDMSKIESGSIALADEEFNLGDFMYDLIHMNSSEIKEKEQEFNVEVIGVKHENVIADKVRLQQVMTNIVSNANKYTPIGGRIEVRLTEKPAHIRGYGCYEFVCRDNGMGMGRKFQEKIFQPFEREQTAQIQRIQGTGLGLAISKNIIDMMGGIIKVSSEPGRGTVFTVIVNMKLQDEGTDEKLPSLLVLVVDDDETFCVNTAEMLVEMGLKSEWVLSGEEAVKKCVEAEQAGEGYAAVILDWKMPHMDGLETAKQIRRHVSGEMTLIILSAYNSEQIEAEIKETEITTFLTKPLFKSKLYHKLKSLLLKEGELEENIGKSISRFDFAGKHILLAEDNELNMEIVMELLNFTNAQIDGSSDGRKTVDRYLSMPAGYYDVILMDIQMPVMNGYEAAVAIRNSGREDAHTVPIIAMTANAFFEDKEKAWEAGMDGYIAKPIDIQKLTETLDMWLNKK